MLKKLFSVILKYSLRFFLVVASMLLLAYFYSDIKSWAATVINKTITSNIDLEDGLVGHWTFDGNLETAVTDRSGNANHGAISGAATSSMTRPGKIGQALEFDGVDDYVSVGDVASIDSATELSVCAWVYHNSIDDDDAIATKLTEGVAHNGFLLWRDDLGTARDDTYAFYVEDSTGDGDTARVEGAANASKIHTWTHVCGSFEAASATGLRLYINGSEDANSPADATTIAAIDAGSGRLLLGSSNDAIVRPFNGLIDDIRIYTRLITPQEVSRLYELGATTKINKTITSNDSLSDGLVGHWTFDGSDMDWSLASAEARDRSGQGRHGNVINFDSGSVTIGKIGQALDFDGSNDYIDAGSLAITTGMPPVTVAAWAWADTLSGESNNLSDMVFSEFANLNSGWGVDFSSEGGGSISLFDDTAGTDNELYSISASRNTWYHIVATIEAGGSTKLYINGVLSGSGSSIANTTNVRAGNFYIGARRPTTNLHDGKIDDVRIYNKVLTPEEVTRLYELGATTKINQTIVSDSSLNTGLEGHWTFDGKDMNWELTSAEVRDISTAGNHGDAVNYTATSTIPGVIGQAIDYNATNSYSSLAGYTGTSVNPDTVYTVSLWVKELNTDTNRVLLHRGDANRCLYNPLISINNSTSRVNFNESGCSGSGNMGVFDLLPNTWNHIAMTRNDSIAKGYVNGVLVVTDSSLESPIASSATELFLIGARQHQTTGIYSFIDNPVDDVRAYNRELSAEEILQLYQLGR